MQEKQHFARTIQEMQISHDSSHDSQTEQQKLEAEKQKLEAQVVLLQQQVGQARSDTYESIIRTTMPPPNRWK